MYALLNMKDYFIRLTKQSTQLLLATKQIATENV